MIPIGPGPSLEPLLFAFIGASGAMVLLLAAWMGLVLRPKDRRVTGHVLFMLWTITMPVWLPAWVLVSAVLLHSVEEPVAVLVKVGLPAGVGILVVWLASRTEWPIFCSIAATGFAVLPAMFLSPSGAALGTPLTWAVITAAGVFVERSKVPTRRSRTCELWKHELVHNVSGICPECGTPFRAASAEAKS